ncbi:MAG: DUF1016 family protein [Methanophagales archaeon]|nr:DUF1016 family protein [Methanophagales archaeon]
MSEERVALKEQSSIDTTYQSIRAILEKARSTAYRAVNFAMVQAYWEVGRVIVEEEQKGAERAEYGKALIKELSQRLTRDYGKGFTESNLKYMRQFYLTFPNSHALRGELTWTHYRLLLKVGKEEARNFYMLESVKNNWSTRELERQINSLLYERLALSKDSEKVLEFYNYVLKCFVLIDLKVGKLTHQDIGQMDFYVRYFEKEEKLEGDNPTIGLILCSDKNETMVRYTLLEDSERIFASKNSLCFCQFNGWRTYFRQG